MIEKTPSISPLSMQLNFDWWVVFREQLNFACPKFATRFITYYFPDKISAFQTQTIRPSTFSSSCHQRVHIPDHQVLPSDLYQHEISTELSTPLLKNNFEETKT